MKLLMTFMLVTLSFASVALADEFIIAGWAYGEPNEYDCVGSPIPSYVAAEIKADENAAFRCRLDKLKSIRVSDFIRIKPSCDLVGFGPKKHAAVYVNANYICK